MVRRRSDITVELANVCYNKGINLIVNHQETGDLLWSTLEVLHSKGPFNYSTHSIL